MAGPPDASDEEDDSASARSADPIRLAWDTKAWEAVAADRFSGLRYDRLIDQLIRYALPRMEAVIGSGRIFSLCNGRNAQIRLWSPQDWTTLHRDHEEMANSAVAMALKRFHRSAEEGHGWSPTGGATLATYFMGMCIDEFPNQFRAWLSTNRKRALEALVREPIPSSCPALDGAEVAREEMRQLLSLLKPPQRTAIYLQAQGYNQKEIGEWMGRSVRAVEGLIRRGRRQLEDLREAQS
jgi:DNA-directed RNA polymerase specialized sigma24 family protein